jgi:hypothetical protein
VRVGSVAAGAGRQCAPAALIRPLGSRPELFGWLMRGLRGRAAPQLIR